VLCGEDELLQKKSIGFCSEHILIPTLVGKARSQNKWESSQRDIEKTNSTYVP